MINKHNLEQTISHFESWWRCEDIGRPLMNIRAVRTPSRELFEVPAPTCARDIHFNLDYLYPNCMNYFAQRDFLAESYPCMDINIGPGSVSVYLGSEPVFAWDTVWYEPCIDDINTYSELVYDENNPWWRTHFDVVRRAVELSEGKFYVNIPDLIENIDIIAAMRGPQQTCYDLIDYPEQMHKRIGEVDRTYFEYYDRIHELVRLPHSCSYTAFNVLGRGRVAKVQCDFAALMNPSQFREFIVPSLTKQCRSLDHSVFHLDGKDCIKHIDALLSIEELQAVQWTAGAGQPDGGNEKWYGLYEKIRAAGKSMHVSIYDGNFENQLETADKFIRKFGSQGVYFLFPDMTRGNADYLMNHAERCWG